MRSKFIVAMLGLATFGFGLTACGGDDPVIDNGMSPPDHMIGDAPGAGMAAPANAADAERHDDAALPPLTDGMVWQIDAAARVARFGPAGQSAMPATPLSVECAAPGMRLVRGEAPSSGTATLSFTGNGHVASLEVTARGAAYRGDARGDTLRAIVRTFDGSEPVEATVGDAGDLRLPSSPELRGFLAGCTRG